jgi:hypothetical protein
MPTSYGVKRTIDARPEVIWALLTEAEGYPTWNPTVVSIRGRIASGERIELVSTVNPKRKFSLLVSDVEPHRRMVWSSGLPLGLFRGVRTFSLDPVSETQTEFSMREDYSGALAGLITRTIPDLNEAFGQFADGLMAAAEVDGGSDAAGSRP